MFVQNSEVITKANVLYLNHLILVQGFCQTKIYNTGGPPLTRKSLTLFPLPRFLAYVRVSGELALVGDHSTVPLTRVSCNTVFSKSQKTRKAGTLCM